MKKAGYFSTEKSLVDNVWKELGYSLPQRFPLAYVVEAADDIAYCISDLEDSFEKGLVHEQSALKEIEENFSKYVPTIEDISHMDIKATLAAVRSGKRADGREFTYTDFRTSLNRTIVAFVADRYVANHQAVLDGTLDALLPAKSSCGAVLNALKDYCRNHVYGHESIQRVELAGYTAIRGLLDHFSPLLKCSKSRFNAALDNKKEDVDDLPIIIESKLLKLFPEKYIKVYRKCISTAPQKQLPVCFIISYLLRDNLRVVQTCFRHGSSIETRSR